MTVCEYGDCNVDRDHMPLVLRDHMTERRMYFCNYAHLCRWAAKRASLEVAG